MGHIQHVRSQASLPRCFIPTTWLQICAGYAGQLLNYSQISVAVGVSVPTVQSWLSILEQSYIVFRLPPFYRNITRRLVKTPKLYFYDTGLACYLLRIRDTTGLHNYYNAGALFENLIVADAFKSAYHGGKEPWYTFYRDKTGDEADLVYDAQGQLTLWEIKATETFHPRLLQTLAKVQGHLGESSIARLVYAGDRATVSGKVEVVPWRDLAWPA